MSSDPANADAPSTPQTHVPADDLGFKLNPADITSDTSAEDLDGGLDAAPTAHPSDSEFGASDTVLGPLRASPEAFGPGSGTMGDSNSPSDEAI